MHSNCMLDHLGDQSVVALLCQNQPQWSPAFEAVLHDERNQHSEDAQALLPCKGGCSFGQVFL